MALINNEFENALRSYMGVKGLDIKTVNKYMEFYYKYANIYPELNNKNIDNFLLHNRSSPARAMLKNLVTAVSRWNFPQEVKGSVALIDIPKITGKKEKKDPRHITRQEIEILAKGIPYDNELVDGRTRIMMLVQFWAGLRLEELIGITVSDLLMDDYNPEDKYKTIRIRSESAKFKKERKAYIPKEIYKRLVKWLKMRIESVYNVNKEFNEEESIWGIKGNRYKSLMYKWTLKLLGKRYNTHAFRHGRGTDLKKVEGWDIEYIKEYLGHSDISSTQIYVHLADQDVKDRLEK